jgi:transcriptional regulator with XRE-family HTH domain
VAKQDPILRRLGAAVRAARADTGLSQDRFAAAAGLDRTYFGGLERGERNVGFKALVKVRKALGISWKELGALLDREFGT